jgi:hypothetical protein
MSVQRVAAIGSAVVVVASVIAGLFVTGSPLEQRLLRLDERRVSDLQSLSQAAEFRWDRNETIAGTASELVDGRYLSRLPSDPTTDQPYEYRVTGPRGFEVCAVFDRPARPDFAGDFWSHDAGRHCFAFEMQERAER